MDADLSLAARYPRVFRGLVLIDTDHGPRPLAEVCDDWQAADFAAQDNAWRRLAGQSTTAGPTRFWYERPRGHSKTSDLATSITWALVFSKRRLFGIAAAADKDQARLMRDSIARLAACNSWVEDALDIQAERVVNKDTESELKIISSDVGSSYGVNPDFICVDEVTHWSREQGRGLWESLLSSAAKRAHCVLISICNAGWLDTWQYQTRESIREDPSWCFRRLEGPCASWISEAALLEQRRLLQAYQYQRLWLNCYVSGTDHPLISEDDLAAAITLPGPLESFPRELGPYCGGLDVGTRRDKTAFVIVACDPLRSKLRLAYVQLWDPAKFGGTLPLAIVERDILQVARQCHLAGIAYDPAESVMLAQRLVQAGGVLYRYPWTSQSKQRMALAAIESFRHRQIALYDHPDLTRDLRRTQVVERADALTFETPRDEHGHGDAASAFLMALIFARGTRQNIREKMAREGHEAFV